MRRGARYREAGGINGPRREWALARTGRGVPTAVLAAVLSLACAPGGGPPAAPGVETALEQRASSRLGVVSAAQPMAALAGRRMLERGGNAADAAVAAGFAISVVEPTMNSIGGRNQILVRLPSGEIHGIDGTTQAPSTYDPATAAQAGYGYATVGVPGALAGLVKLLEDHGSLPLATVMEPAIELADGGFMVLPGEARRQAAAADQIREFEGSRAHFQPDGRPVSAGERFRQPDLARTLRTIAREGRDAFYRGSIARAIAADMEAHGAPVTLRSLNEYRAEPARIVRGSYRGYDVVGTDMPASGAVSIATLHILENLPMGTLDDTQWAAAVGQALSIAMAERPVLGTREAADRILDKAWAAREARAIRLPEVTTIGAGRAEVSGDRVGAPDPDWTGDAWSDRSGNTTHLSAADGDGMAVALTQTIGPNMGSKVATPGLGFLYAATLGGYLGDMAAGERASSSISPLMILRDGEPVLVLGAAGGARIISAVVQAVLRVVDQDLTLADALAAPRVHPVNGGMAMETSPGIGWSDEVVLAIRGLGLQVQTVPSPGSFGRIHGLRYHPDRGEWEGVADPDWEGAVAPAGASRR